MYLFLFVSFYIYYMLEIKYSLLLLLFPSLTVSQPPNIPRSKALSVPANKASPHKNGQR